MGSKTLAILGYSGFIGYRICKNLSKSFKIIKIDRNLKLKKKNKIDYLICCSGPNKYWCLENKNFVNQKSNNFSKKIIEFCKKNHVKNLIYFSSIQVLKKNDRKMKPYINWHKNLELNLKKLKIKKKIIRLPNLFGKPHITKKNFWNFFINFVIKSCISNKIIEIRNNPNQIIYAMPLNFFVKIIKKEINKKFLKLNKIINLNKHFKFKTSELIHTIERTLEKKNLKPKFITQDDQSKRYFLRKVLNKGKLKYFNLEMVDLIKFTKKKFVK